jgi:hypothetical protein
LFFSTGLDGAREFYWRPEITIPDTLVVEFRAQLDFGSSSNPARGPANVVITTSPGVGHLFHINIGEIFFAAGHGEGGQLLKGPMASVPTTGAFHTSRLEVVGNSVAAYYDGTRKLISSSYTDTLDHGLVTRIAFGEGSVAAQGQSEWEYIRHNAGLPAGPPVLFSLQTPSQGDTVPTWRVPLDWTNSVDPDCVAPVSYYVEIDSVSSFPSPIRYGPRAASQDTVVVPFAQGLSWYWRVKAKDAGGDSTLATPAFGRFVTYNAGYPTAVESPATPRRFALFPGRPNPFNPSTRIEFELPGSTAARVRADIYTVQGRRVRRLLDASKPPGRHSVTWDGKDDPGRDAAAGVYYFVLRTADGSRTIKLVLVR